MRNSGPTNGTGSRRGASNHPFVFRADDSVGLLARITPLQGTRGVALAEKTGRGWTHRPAGRGRRAFTRVELCACLAAGALLLTLALPALANGRSRSHLAQCFNNLRQIGAGFQSWAMSAGEKFPWQLNLSDGGTRNSPFVANPWVHFSVLSNHISARVLVCPNDNKRSAGDFGTQNGGFLLLGNRDNALSYLLGLHAEIELPRQILSADREIRASGSQTCGKVGPPAYALVPGDTAVGWTNLHGATGDLLFADGSVETLGAAGLQKVVNVADGPDSPATHVLIPRNPLSVPE